MARITAQDFEATMNLLRDALKETRDIDPEHVVLHKGSRTNGIAYRLEIGAALSIPLTRDAKTALATLEGMVYGIEMGRSA